MDYSAVLKRAWNIALNNRFLWVFGFLVGGFSSANVSYIFNGSSSGSGSSESPAEIIRQLPELQPALRGLGIDLNFGLILGFFFLVLSIFLALAVIGVLAQGSLISSVRRIELGETPTLRSAFREGGVHLPWLIGISLAIWLPFSIFVLFMIVALGGIIFIGYSLSTLALVASILFAAVVLVTLLVTGVVLGILGIFAASYRVFLGGGVWDSIQAAYALLVKEKGSSALLWLIIAGLSIAFGIAAGAFAGLLFIPVAMGFLLTPVIGVALAALALVLTGVVGSVAQTFFSSFWTLSFMRLSGLDAGDSSDSDTEADHAL